MVKSIAVFEYTVGGGFSKTQLNTKLLVEGYAMLYTVVEDLKNSGYRVITTIDERLASTIKIPTDESMMIPYGETPLEKLESALKFIDGILLIAPAFKDALYETTRFMEKAGVNVLGSKSGGVLKASDKRLTLLSLKKANLPTPKTKVADINENVDEVRLKVEEIGYPVVFKPADGSGCEGISLVKDYSKISQALNLVRKNTKTKHFLIQEFLGGVHVSVSLLTDGENILPLTLNMQKVKLKEPSKGSGYFGGVIPFNHPMAEEAKKVACLAVESIDGLKGYVGVDMILTREGPIIVEVNPRITTSYLGLRKVLRLKLGEALVKAGLGLGLPKKIDYRGVVIVSKTSLPKGFNRECSSNVSRNIKVFNVPQSNFLLATVYGRSYSNARKAFKRFREKVLRVAG